MLKFAQAGVFDMGNTHRLALRYIRPGTVVSTFEFRVKFFETLPIRATGERIGTRLDRAQFKATHAFQDIERPTGGFAKFAVVDDVDARLGLPPYDFSDRIFEASLVSTRVNGLAVLLRTRHVEKQGRADEAANMR